jgi:hypothetical protein
MGQEFFEMEHINSLFKKIQTFPPDGSGPRCVYNNAKRYNENLGLFFVNNKSGEKKEWTWPQLDTVNLFVELIRNELVVTISNPDGGQVPYPCAYFCPSAKDSILLALGEEKSGLIASTYDSNSSSWMFQNLASEGKVSSTVEAMAYLQRVADNITREHLELLSTMSPSHTHHGHQPHHPFSSHSPLVSNSTPSPVTPSSSSPHGHSPCLSKRTSASPGYPEGIYNSTPPEKQNTPENQNKIRQINRRDQPNEQPDMKKRRLYNEDK